MNLLTEKHQNSDDFMYFLGPQGKELHSCCIQIRNCAFHVLEPEGSYCIERSVSPNVGVTINIPGELHKIRERFE